MSNYNVLIIEQLGDEQDQIPTAIRQFSEIGLVLCAHNAEDGFRLFQIHQPELIIIDVDHMDRLAFIDQVVQCVPTTVCIMVGEWRDVSFFRHILPTYTFDYIPKPYQMEELIEVFSRCITWMNKKYQYVETMIQKRLEHILPEIDHIVLQTIVNDHEISRLVNYLNVYEQRVCESFCAVLAQNTKQDIIQYVIKQLTTMHLHVIHDDVDDMHVFLVCNQTKFSSPLLNKVKQLMDEINHDEFILGVGFIKQDTLDYHTSYLEALEILNEQRINKKEAQDELFDEIQNKQLEIYGVRIVKDYMLNNLEAYFSDIRSLSSLLQGYRQHQVNLILTQLLNGCEQYIKQTYSEYRLTESDSYLIVVDEEHPFLSIHRQLQQVFKQLLQPLHMEKSSTSFKVVQQADAFIRKNYKKQLTLEQLANHLNVSTYYICRLFQEHTMMSFIDIVNMYRIEDAKKLLLSEKRIKDIAFEVGFKSSTYFGRVFKQSINMTPKQYRMKYRVYYREKNE